MPTITFDALDYCKDQSFAAANYRYDGDEQHGWKVSRDGRQILEFGPGYRLLRVRQCGICSTDLARHFLPFPLPQVIGHEVIAEGHDGRRFVVEINASHTARGVAADCAFCNAGLPTHCPSRVTLGIHDLPGGFGPWILAPIAACLEVPTMLPDSTAVLVEPFAAALHAVHSIQPRNGERIAVLGPRRLGMLVVAALAGVRREMLTRGLDFAIAAVVRNAALLPLAREFGATETHVDNSGGAGLEGAFDVVIDTTGSADGLVAAVKMARREVHLKSTHGRDAAGLHQLTALVVDELAIARFPAAPADDAPWHRLRTGSRPRVAWLAAATPPAWLQQEAEVRRGSAVELAAHYARATDGLPRADVAVVDSARQVDAVIRPDPDHERSLLRPRGACLLHRATDVADSPLLAAVVARGLVLSSSRCGDFAAALQLLAGDADLRNVGERLVTHRFAAKDLVQAFATARTRECIKAVVEQPGATTA